MEGQACAASVSATRLSISGVSARHASTPRLLSIAPLFHPDSATLEYFFRGHLSSSVGLNSREAELLKADGCSL